MPETRSYWRHAHFRDLGLMRARFRAHRYARHTHASYVVALVTDGCERVTVAGRAVLVPAGRILIVHPEEWHDGEAGGDQGWAYRTFYPSVALMRAVAAGLGTDGEPGFPRLIDDPPLAAALRHEHDLSVVPDALVAEASMLVALEQLVARHAVFGRPLPQGDASGAARRMLLYARLIDEDVGGVHSLTRFAAATDVTRYQVIRDFKRVSGQTPGTYLRDRRLRHACDLIEGGESTAQAAFASGFADQSHLTRTFRAAMGVTPGLFGRGCRASLCAAMETALAV